MAESSPDLPQPNYSYTGRCPFTGQALQLPRTAATEAAARTLMAELQAHDQSVSSGQPRYNQEGKMYGVLLAERAMGQGESELVILRAFSGLLWGCAEQSGWVPPLPGRERVALAEAETLAALARLKQEIGQLQQLPERVALAQLQHEFNVAQQALQQQQQQAKQQRQVERERLAADSTDPVDPTDPAELRQAALAQLRAASQAAKRVRKQFNQTWQQRLAPLQTLVAAADQRILLLKQQRRQLSRQLQVQMHEAYTLRNFAGQSYSLANLAVHGWHRHSLPTGTGECCAPKLLHAAAAQGLHPLGMAEFWWGPSRGEKQAGQFYPACAERCQPIMGYLLTGLGRPQLAIPPSPSLQVLDLQVLYEDEWLVAIHKPTGMLSVPGRGSTKPESVLLQLQVQRGRQLYPLHRLDQETSGVLLFAKDLPTYRVLAQQWQQQVQKQYLAILNGTPSQSAGLIDLPLWGNPDQRPRQSVNVAWGKPSQTQYQVLAQQAGKTWVAFSPLTGRTHQIRVHAAVGLGLPIWGDRLYGCTLPASRLHLHAQSLEIWHPHRQQSLQLVAESPF